LVYASGCTEDRDTQVDGKQTRFFTENSAEIFQFSNPVKKRKCIAVVEKSQKQSKGIDIPFNDTQKKNHSNTVFACQKEGARRRESKK
jgi:hypothetical protein